jgi:hypothetical protein
MKLLLPLLFLFLVLNSCIKKGCTNPDATNYKKRAVEDNGSCVYPELRDDMIGEYAVEKTVIIHVGSNQGTTSTFDTITIEKGYEYNSLSIDNSTFNINFQTFNLSYLTDIHKYPPYGGGSLLNGVLKTSVTNNMYHGGTYSNTYISGYKIN